MSLPVIFDNRIKALRKTSASFLRQTPEDKYLLVKAGAIIILCRGLLKIMPVNRAYTVLSVFLRKPVHHYTEYRDYTTRVVRCVKMAGRCLLRTKCLSQALTIHLILNRKRIRNDLCIGVARHADNFSAHAWIQAGNDILTGEHENIHYYFKTFLNRPHA